MMEEEAQVLGLSTEFAAVYRVFARYFRARAAQEGGDDHNLKTPG